MIETLVDKTEMINNLKKENRGNVMAVLYEEGDEQRSAVGFYYGIKGNEIDLRNFQGRVQNLLNMPEGYQILNISLDSFIEYRKLQLVERK